ncbi:MAG: NAD regulator [Bauldia sp.]|uniref:NUDIX hydrolase n=1 Tax=Bauldia sp. TaxID=2575872 RepID=UPI001D23A177|nr:NAD regulator [Bauldia sp.]MCB1498105.1 NAD regulator [Bauldia sp.]
MAPATRPPIEIGLNAAIVAVEDQQPLILVVSPQVGPGEPDGLPFGPFDPILHRTLEMGLRAWVEEQTALKLGYVEQLYTFGDRGRHAHRGDRGPHLVSVGYLALTGPEAAHSEALTLAGARWQRWYGFFPWEDWRDGRPALLDQSLLPALRRWERAPPGDDPVRRGLTRRERVRLAFGSGGQQWDEERVLDRYELLYEAGLVHEALRDGRASLENILLPAGVTGMPMRFDHRRVLATAISRLRAKLKYRPVVFELMPEAFTLTDLQLTVEAISGRRLHKQNFRRLVEAATLVEPTGEATRPKRGRPAALFRFRREVVQERPAPGLRLGSRA